MIIEVEPKKEQTLKNPFPIKLVSTNTNPTSVALWEFISHKPFGGINSLDILHNNVVDP